MQANSANENTHVSKHRVTVWARGVNGVPVTCTCGWKDYGFTVMGAYKRKREHEATKEES